MAESGSSGNSDWSKISERMKIKQEIAAALMEAFSLFSSISLSSYIDSLSI